MSIKARLAIMTAVLLWASAFIGIRLGLQFYSPQGMALLRFMIASLCMGVIYYFMPARSVIHTRDIIALMTLGGVSVGIYNLFLNFAEVSVLSGVASFVTSQSPIIAAILAAVFLGEGLTVWRVTGFLVSVSGTALMTYGEFGDIKWTAGMAYLLIATLAGSLYSILQKPFLKRYHAIEATTFVIWGCTLFLLIYLPYLAHDVHHASLTSTIAVIYLGVFPAAVGYVAWAYALSEISATRAMNYLYLMPFIATLLGWLILGELPMALTLSGGLLAILGVMIGNYSRHTSR